MPLITITCHRDWYPADNPVADTPYQRSTMQFAEELPGLFSDNAKELGMDDCPHSGVQVNFELFHRQALNAPLGIWVKVEMTEVPERNINVRDVNGVGFIIPVRDEVAETEITGKLMELMVPLLAEISGEPQYAVDVFWGPGHGWLKFGDTKLDW